MSKLYEDLGVARDADGPAITRAYRKKAMSDHPDRGGSPEKFHQIQRAYDTLSDPARRARYDEHGEEPARDARSELLQQLAALFLGAIDACDVDHTDIVAQIRHVLEQAKVKQQEAIAGHAKKIARRERAARRISRKGGGDNLMLQFIEGDIAGQQRGIVLAQAEAARLDQLVALLAEYQYAVEQEPRVRVGSVFEQLQGMGGRHPWA